MTSKKIDIICFFDHLHKPLYDLFFKPSFDLYLSSNFNLLSIFDENQSNNGSYQSHHWCDMILKRFDILREYIRNNTNKWAIFTDIDIVFFSNIFDDINHTINSNTNQKIFYMPENSTENKLNGGFFLFRCCKEVDDLFGLVQKQLAVAAIKNDQPIIQGLLDKSIINYGLLDTDLFMTNNHDQQFILSKLYKIKVFHATSAPNIWSKVQILSSICIYRYNLSNQSGNLWAI